MNVGEEEVFEYEKQNEQSQKQAGVLVFALVVSLILGVVLIYI